MAEPADDDADHVRYSVIPSTLHPVLPSNAIVRYRDEGAANIVYSVSVPPFTADEAIGPFYNNRFFLPNSASGLSIFEGKLLRLRKNLPYTAACQVAHSDFLRFVAPHFENDDLVSQSLVQLKPSGLVKKLNEELERWDRIPYSNKGSYLFPYRPVKRHGIYLADDDYGLLVADMQPPVGSTWVEFKPKWLVQSPAAPQYSRRCRTCAKRAYTNAQRIRANLPPQIGFCPLDLVSEDEKLIYRTTKTLLAWEDPISPSNYRKLNQFCQWAKHSPLLKRLKIMQDNLDRKGVFSADPQDKNFLVAMTLRDCSVFMQIPDNVNLPVTVKLGDLDLKLPEKAEYWKTVEAPLIAEGWYLGIEKEEDRQPLDCNLFPDYWTPRDQRDKL